MDQMLLNISFGVAAFIFEAVLLVLLIVLGHGQRNNNMKFRTLVILVLAGNFASILDNVFRNSNFWKSPMEFQLFLQVSVLVLNVFLTYYVYLYLGTFVERKPKEEKINRIIIIASVCYGVFLFVRALFQLHGNSAETQIPLIGRILIGYAVELYFLISSMIFVIHFRHGFEKRAFYTGLAAYAAIISTIILQLVERRGILLNYFGAVIGSYIFYIGVEIPDHRNFKISMHVLKTLTEAIDAKDTYTHGHSGRVAEYSREIAKRAGYDDKAQNEIYMMGLLHDVGKIGVADTVINKPGRLSDEEFEAIKRHPGIGSRILRNIKEMPKLQTGARWHHERYDGKGYPDNLKGSDIPAEARIIAVADAYDAMTSNRSYRGSMPQEKVREQITKGRGTQFDPEFADIMVGMIDEDTAYQMREL